MIYLKYPSPQPGVCHSVVLCPVPTEKVSAFNLIYFPLVCWMCWIGMSFCLCEVLWRWAAWSRNFKRVYDKAILTSPLFISTRVCRAV